MVKETEEEGEEEDGLEYMTNTPSRDSIQLCQAQGVVLYLLRF